MAICMLSSYRKVLLFTYRVGNGHLHLLHVSSHALPSHPEVYIAQYETHFRCSWPHPSRWALHCHFRIGIRSQLWHWFWTKICKLFIFFADYWNAYYHYYYIIYLSVAIAITYRGTAVLNGTYVKNPIMLQITLASMSVQPSSHMVPQTPLAYTSTRPSLWLPLPNNLTNMWVSSWTIGAGVTTPVRTHKMMMSSHWSGLRTHCQSQRSHPGKVFFFQMAQRPAIYQ